MISSAYIDFSKMHKDDHFISFEEQLMTLHIVDCDTYSVQHIGYHGQVYFMYIYTGDVISLG